MSTDDSEQEKSKALTCKHKLQELNHYVKVTVVCDQKYSTVVDYLKEQKEQKQDPFKVVVMTEFFGTKKEEILSANKFCRESTIPFIYTFVVGCSAKILTDFGESFKVIEQNSEEIPDVMIDSITATEDKDFALFTLKEGYKH
jgi:molybdopterin/thiamine biosynthesis adenylyltransferase